MASGILLYLVSLVSVAELSMEGENNSQQI